jgi:histidine triad (HIT) family protein
MIEECIFCKIIKGEIPSYTVYEDERFKVILDRFPASRGHCLILSKGHHQDLFEMPEDLLKEVYPVAKKIGEALKAALNATGINIVQNNGAHAGQTVMHFHLHLIPRNQKDEIILNQSSLQDITLQELEDVAKKIKDYLA